MPLPVVAIVGRPNVGKSTLFNRLIGFRKAMVHDRAGVTRDRLYEEATVIDRQVLLVDTGGLDPDPDTSDLLASMRRQTLIAVEEADVIVFLVDGRAGFTAADAEVGDLLRRTSKPVVLAVNKIDGQRHEDLAGDFWSVGLTPLVTVSAAHGRGIWELLESIKESLPEADEEADEVDLQGELLEDDTDEAPAFEGPIRIAVVGRPNIGKSTLINRLLGEDRHVVNDAPGTTMDPIDSTVRVGDRDLGTWPEGLAPAVLVDTAGGHCYGRTTLHYTAQLEVGGPPSVEARYDDGPVQAVDVVHYPFDAPTSIPSETGSLSQSHIMRIPCP